MIYERNGHYFSKPDLTPKVLSDAAKAEFDMCNAEFIMGDGLDHQEKLLETMKRSEERTRVMYDKMGQNNDVENQYAKMAGETMRDYTARIVALTGVSGLSHDVVKAAVEAAYQSSQWNLKKIIENIMHLM